MSYNVEGYEHGEILSYGRVVDGEWEVENVVVDEVLDDTVAVRYENDWDVFSVAYGDVYRPVKSVEELLG